MPKNALIHPDELPLELQLDLLVDGELTEPRRRQLLRRIDRQPAEWRTLAIRFLQQQTEKQSAKSLMKGGTLIPAEVIAPEPRRQPVIGRVGWYRITGIAAALFIAAGSALVTLMIVNHAAPRRNDGLIATPAPTEFQTSIPADVISGPAPLPVRVPIVRAADQTQIFPAPDSNLRGTTTKYLVQPDGKDGYMVIPVSTSNSPVY